ncbi:aldo/keto reductase [Leptothrix cholodnii SP-6]|uniref:Aldo/keto reductase n=1 Tax=Leptothrix cholodnii (strain ATCC 51168 / LMG 8142 / SP-6) TaxID=395495 RepID=B1Y1P6_LEPCP|nr:aldo/keto reductase [Leptothrix cholodnii]ACB35508.1 aldo/keto reductase [Leptothrix cholodnii SP-6]
MSSTPPYQAAVQRYDTLPYRRCGRSGLKLGAVSLGLWHNFGDVDRVDTMRETLRCAFDLGVTHFDLANNYGPPPGSAEEHVGALLKQDFSAHRDELILSTKAGYRMGPGPYGDGGSRKYLVASLDQSLRRMQVDHVDIFYHHRPDPDTPLEETMDALAHIVRSGRALYVGVSNYPPALLREAARLLRASGTPCLIHQPRYNLLDRQIEGGLLDALADEGVGCIAFSPLAQGLLTDRYLCEIPADSRAAKGVGFLRPTDLTPQRLRTIAALNRIALTRGQTLAQMALAWVLRHPGMTSVLIGASRPQQVRDAVAATATAQLGFDAQTLAAIEVALAGR